MVKILLSLKQDFFYFLFFLQFALEGETTTGNEGDIALDDLSVFYIYIPIYHQYELW